MEEELDAVLKKLKAEMFLKVWKTKDLTTYSFDYATLSINKQNRDVEKSCILCFSQKDDHGITRATPTEHLLLKLFRFRMSSFSIVSDLISRKFSRKRRIDFGAIDP